MLIIWTTPPLPIENLLFKLIHLTCVKLISLGGDVVFVMLWWKHPCYSADIHVVTHFSSTALRHSYLSIKLSLTLSIGMILLQRHPLWRSTRNIFFYCYGHRIFRSDVLLTFIILTLILKWYINHFRDLNFPKSMLALCVFYPFFFINKRCCSLNSEWEFSLEQLDLVFLINIFSGISTYRTRNNKRSFCKHFFQSTFPKKKNY